MTSQLEHIRPVATPGRVGQGTAVEQSRAVAEVQAQVIVAQQFPRSMQAAVRAMEEACAQPALAGRALFRFPRGKNDDGTPNILSGPSVHIARELARCFGNLQYGLTEMVRDDAHGQSELMAWAWDMEANTRSSTTFIVPHKRDTKWGAKDLTDLRDIYENNANNGGRRMREMIFAVLPGWYVTRALELCAQTNEKGGGKPLAQRITDAVKAFEQYRISPARIAAKWAYRSVDELTATDVAQLAVIYSSIQQGTVTVDDEFPAEVSARPSAADITGQPAAPKSPSPAGPEIPSSAPSAPSPADAEPAGEAAHDAVTARLADLGVDTLPAQLRTAGRLAGRVFRYASDVSAADALAVLGMVRNCATPEDLDGLLADLELASDPRGEVAESE